MRAHRFRTHPALLILVATAISGGCGYVIGILVPRAVPAAEYASFAVVWSTLFFLVGAMAGLQQEFARATRSRRSGSQAGRGASQTLSFAVIAATGAIVVLGATSPIWGRAAVPTATLGTVLAIVAGVAVYVVIAVCVGSLYGLHAWRPIAAMLIIDGVARLAAVMVILAVGGDGTALSVAIVLPFPVALLAVLPFITRLLRRDTSVETPVRTLVTNSAQLIAAAASTAALVSGVPLILQLSLPEVSHLTIAPILLALTLTRAPIVIPLLALQSYLVVRFREGGPARAIGLSLAVLAAGLALAVALELVGPPVLSAVFGPAYDLDPVALGLIVASSGTLAAMCVATAALVATGRHTLNTAAWMGAIIATIVLLLIPGSIQLRVGAALFGGSAIGLIVHLIAILAGPRVRDRVSA